ncbi:MAG: helicase-exonuclease AddAB subunit AddA [Turicibacter sp.]|nr:helicase-exonuclease AddAB subunit AddA [Turicibacter sp.]
MIPIKPQDAIWNDPQWQAIHAKKDEILVSAGAGSGKTAVLVERIVQKILGEGVHVDELLVLTFTKAAAAEMKERIRHRIEGLLLEQPQNGHLRSQLAKLPRAQISTFHAFCDHLIRRYYYLLDIDPAYVIADDIDVGLIADSVLESLFDDLSESEDPAFIQLVDSFNSDRDDEALKTMILKIYHLAAANPKMDQWLSGLSGLYEWDGESLDSWPYYKELVALTLPMLEAASADLRKAKSFAQQAAFGEVPHKYPTEVQPLDVAYLNSLRDAVGSYEVLRGHYHNTQLPKFPTFSKKNYDKELHDQANGARKDFRAKVDKLKGDFFGYSNQTHQKHFSKNKEIATHLSALAKKFHERFQAAKKERGLLDFSDLEWHALQLLMGEGGVPTDVAIQAHGGFKEIMIDEYQDTNSMQETIVMAVAKAAAPPVPVFMVGDVKQSIYKFRLAEPRIFREKYDTYPSDMEAGSPYLKIDLMENYRSHAQVIDATNYIFSQVMDVPVGEIQYDEAAKLKLGVKEESQPFHTTEVHLLDKKAIDEGDADDLSAVELEARHIAATISNWVADGQAVYDRKAGTDRPLAFRDIVVLMRSLTHVGVYQDVFRQYGIPLFTEQSTDLFSSIEIINLLSCLKTIDNPYQDIPLVGLMRSPLFLFDEIELATIKKSSTHDYFYGRVLAFSENNAETILGRKVSDFISALQGWRFASGQETLSRLISQIYEQTLYYEFVLGLPHGTLRKANLDVFLERAQQYDLSTKKGLYGFICHIERMQELGKHFGIAKTVTATEDVVRIMSIHKSKGLEFPVVFVSSIQKQFNKRDELGDSILHKNYGVALKYIDPDLRLKQKTIAQQLVSNVVGRETLAEEMRLLYVAMTRAKSKLVFTGVFDVEKKLLAMSKASVEAEGETLLPATYRMQAKSYGDLLLPAIIRHPQGLKSLQDFELPNPVLLMDGTSWEVRVVTEALEPAPLSQEAGENVPGPPLIDLSKAFDKPYAFKELTGISAKQSVSQRKLEETVPTFTGIPKAQETAVYDRPSFMQAISQSAAEQGTAFHQFMQHLPVQAAWDLPSLKEQLGRLVQKEILQEALAKQIDLQGIFAFTQSPLYHKLGQAIAIKKEVPFMTLVNVGESKQSTVLLQGVIDLLAEFEDEVFIVDYKTDYVKDFGKQKESLKKRYEIQIKYYQKAVQEIFPQKRVSSHVYFIKAKEAIIYQ